MVEILIKCAGYTDRNSSMLCLKTNKNKKNLDFWTKLRVKAWALELVYVKYPMYVLRRGNKPAHALLRYA